MKLRDYERLALGEKPDAHLRAIGLQEPWEFEGFTGRALIWIMRACMAGALFFLGCAAGIAADGML